MHGEDGNRMSSSSISSSALHLDKGVEGGEDLIVSIAHVRTNRKCRRRLTPSIDHHEISTRIIIVSHHIYLLE